MTNNTISNSHSHPNHDSKPTRAFFFGLLLCLAPTLASAQTEVKIELEDSRGNLVEDKLTIGRSLFVSLQDFETGTDYRLSMLTGDGQIVDEQTTTPSGHSWAEQTRLFFKSNIWAEGCQPDGGPTSPGGSGNVLGPFSNLSDASAELHDMTLWLSVEQKVVDVAGGHYWLHLLSRPITMVEPDEAVYYWSDADGHEQCFFESRENIYLSVYKGNYETFDVSRVFMLSRPKNQSDWTVGYDFDEVRYRPGCFATEEDDCSYDNGSEETLPSTMTIPMRGHLPKVGVFLAIIRGSEAQGSERMMCDRSTEGTVSIKSQPHLTETQEGWGCPPCS